MKRATDDRTGEITAEVLHKVIDERLAIEEELTGRVEFSWAQAQHWARIAVQEEEWLAESQEIRIELEKLIPEANDE